MPMNPDKAEAAAEHRRRLAEGLVDGLQEVTGLTPALARTVVVTVLDMAVDAMRAEAQHLVDSKAKGHVAVAQGIRSGSDRLYGYTLLLTNDSDQRPKAEAVSSSFDAWARAVGGAPSLPEVATQVLDELSTIRATAGVLDQFPAAEPPVPTVPQPIALVDREPAPAAPLESVAVMGMDGTVIEGLAIRQDFTAEPVPSIVEAAPMSVPEVDPFADPKARAKGQAHNPVPWDNIAAMRLTLLERPSPTVSVSKRDAVTDCGLRVQLDSGARLGLVPQPRPSWAMIGGNAFHAWFEAFERGVADAVGQTPFIDSSAGTWEIYLDRAIAEVLGGEWKLGDIRASNKGLEGFDWWRVEGQAMCKRYADYHDAAYRDGGRRYIAQFPDATGKHYMALETPFKIALTPTLSLSGRLDAVWNDNGMPLLTDVKTGSMPPRRFQLAAYSHVLKRVYGVPDTLRATFWDARAGKYSEPKDYTALVPWHVVEAELITASNMERSGLLLPRPSTFCGACGHAGICPARETSA